MAINQRSKRSTIKKLSRLLTLALITTVFAAVPSANATTPSVSTSADLIAAGINSDVTVITIAANITLTADLVINHSMTVNGGDGVAPSATLYGHGIIIQGGATVSLNHLDLNGFVSQPDGNYGVMIQGASALTAHHVVMVLNAPGKDNDAFNVASGSSLVLHESNISWGANVATGTQQYGVYAQSGATAITFTGDTFDFNAPNTSGAHSYLVGMQGALVANYPTITFTGTASTYDSELKLLLYGADSVVNKQTYAQTHSVDVTATNNKIGIIDGTNDGIYTYYAVGGWGMKNESQLRAALLTNATNIYVGADIALTSDLAIDHAVSIHGNGFAFSGAGIVTSGTADDVALSDLHLNGVVHQAGDGNYGVMVQGTSHLTATSVSMLLNTPGENNVGFNVNAGATLTLNTSDISWGLAVATGTQQYGVYAQSGAGAISFTGDTFDFNAPNTSGAHSYLIGMQGALVSDYPPVTIATTTYDSELKLLLYGADTVVNKQTYATTHSVDVTATNNKIGIIDGTNDGIYTYYAANGWGMNTESQLKAALLTNATDIYIGKNITLTSDLSIARSVTVHGNDFTLSGAGITTSGIASAVVLGDLTLTGVVHQVGDGNYGVMVQGTSQLTANNITMVLNTPGENNVGFNVNAGATLTLNSSDISWGLAVATGTQQYGVYAQSGAGLITFAGDTFDFNAPNTSGAHSYLIGMQGALVANYPALTIGTTTYDSELKLLLYGADTVVNKQTYATTHSVAATVTNNKIGIIDGTNDGIYTFYAEGWGVYTAAIGGVTAPVIGATPVAIATTTSQITGTVTWAPTLVSSFVGAVGYTATITLTAVGDYTLAHVPANFFTVAGATTVTNSAGSGVVTAVFAATAANAAITSITPATGPIAGGTVVTIVGTNFTGATTVRFDGVLGTAMVVNSSTSITVTAPAHNAGIVAVVIATPHNGSATASVGYTYLTTPTITSISPVTGLNAGGTTVTLTGSNFSGATSVTFGGVAGTDMVVVSSTSITVKTPEHALGLVNIAVINNFGTASLTGAYTYTLGAVAITLTGENFNTNKSAAYNGISVGFALGGTAIADVASVSISLKDSGGNILVTNTSKSASSFNSAAGHYSSAFRVQTGTYTTSSTWNLGSWSPVAGVIPASALVTVTDIYGYEYTTTLSLLSDTTGTWASLFGITVTGENFNTNAAADYFGISVGFALSGAGIADVASVSVVLKDGGTTLVTNTSKSAASFNAAFVSPATSKSYSSAFRVKTGTYTTSSTWNLGDTSWTPLAKPTSAVITVTDVNGYAYSATISVLSETGATWASVLAGAAQLITFTQPAAMTVGDSDQTLTATSDSALTVTVASTTPSVCTIVALKAHAVAAGNCSLAASQAGAGIYSAASPVIKTFLISAVAVPPTYYYAQVALVVVPAATTLQLTKTTTLSTTGGSGSGALTYVTTTLLICSVTAGVVTAIATGSCLITATKAADGNYYSATSAVFTLTVSDSDAVAAAAAKVIADKLAADKAAADKVIADAAAAKAAADQALADKAAADKLLADAAAQKAAADALSVKNTISIVTVTGLAQRNKITLDLSYKYAYESATVQFGTISVVKGKVVWSYVDFYHVILDADGNALVTRTVSLKSSLLLKVGMQVRVLLNNKVIRTITISKI